MNNQNCNILNSIYDKKITCPVCGGEFTSKVVKSSSIRIESKDSDFFIRYLGANPYFFDVWVCEDCGYAAMKSDFPNIKSFEKDIIKNEISSKWKPRSFEEINDPNEAIDKYKLALITAVTLKKKNSTIAFLLLKIAWMYRILENEANEQVFLKEAVECFVAAYSKEDFPIYGLTRDSLTYLIGDIYRRVNRDEDALTWYSRSITTIGAAQRIKELARNGRDLIKEKETVKNEE